jgi:hypothetical protein
MITDCSKSPYPRVTFNRRIGYGDAGIEERETSELELIVIDAFVAPLTSQLSAPGTIIPDDTAILVIL